jgi:hypothetical protein
MTTTNSDGSRKSLAQQIDRLDAILDGLADALQGAVAAAVQQAVGTAVREAVQAVLVEVLSDPQLLAVLRASNDPPNDTTPESGPAQPQAEKPQGQRPPSCWQRARRWLCGKFQSLRQVCARCLGCLARAMRGLRPALAACGVGLLTGAVAYFAGPWLAAGAVWLGAFVTGATERSGLALAGHLCWPVPATVGPSAR